MTEQQAASAEENLLDRAREAFDAGGVGGVVATLGSVDNPRAAAAAFNDLLQDLYQKRQDVTGMIAVAEAGIAFCRDGAKGAQSPELAKDLKQMAKAIAYNAGANCWPGWGDEGVEIAPAHVRSGFRLAEVNREMVRDLQLGPTKEGVSLWLIGALKLAAGDPAAALADFEESRRLTVEGGEGAAGVLLADGYCGLARKALPASASGGAQELERAVARLREMGSKEANFFAGQLVTADRILLAK